MVPRKGDGTAEHLEQAALRLFQEQGYDRTTAAEIAAQAGVTERTFFRYFQDKREVLFSGQATVLAFLTTAIGEAPLNQGPLDTLFWSFQKMLPSLEANQAQLSERHAVIANSEALREREATKLAALGDALASALEARGVVTNQSIMAARIGMMVFGHAVSSWLADPAGGLAARLNRTYADLRLLLLS